MSLKHKMKNFFRRVLDWFIPVGKRSAKEISKGLVKENPTLVMLLGLCPTLAVTSSAQNGLGMGLATLFVLLGSNIVISLIKKAVPGKVRIPIFIVVIATFVTIIQFVMEGFFPDLNRSLGLFIPLIVVNCIILGRAEAFASKNNIYYSILDAIGMGLGFTLALVLIGSIREILGANKIFGMDLVPGYEPMGLFILPPGAFLTMGLIIAVINKLKQGKKD